MLWHHWHLFLLSVLLGRHPCSVHLSAADAQRRSRGEKRAPQTRLPLPEWYGRAVRPPPHRGARWLVLTRRMRGGRPAAAGGAAGPAGPAGSGPPQAGRAGPGRAGRSWGTGQGSPGAGKGRLVIAGSAVGEERGLCVGVGPQVCVRGSAAAGAGAGYGGVGAVSVPCLCGGGGAVAALLEPRLAAVGADRGLVVPWGWCVLPWFPPGRWGRGLLALGVALAECGGVGRARGPRAIPLPGAASQGQGRRCPTGFTAGSGGGIGCLLQQGGGFSPGALSSVISVAFSLAFTGL